MCLDLLFINAIQADQGSTRVGRFRRTFSGGVFVAAIGREQAINGLPGRIIAADVR